uniref:Uncharacterized protein n=1 Tax=Theileria annulata TaxID=5874 RepID=A0A3B0MVZ9_THEAN
MCILFLILLIFTNSSSCLYCKRNIFQHLSFLLDNPSGSSHDSSGNRLHPQKLPQKSTKKETQLETFLNPVTYDKIPVFCAKAGSDLLKTPDKHGSYTYFMDYDDALEVVNNYFGYNSQETGNQFGVVECISLKKWFEMADPSKKRIKNYKIPKLLPSKHQNLKMVYKLKDEYDQVPIPVYYSVEFVVTTSTFWSFITGSSQRRSMVYFFNYQDLMDAILRIEDKGERNKALGNINVTSLLTLLTGNDPGKILFFPSKRSSNAIAEFTRDRTPWLL